MPHCTISELQAVPYTKIEPEKLTILKGECFIARFIALTDEVFKRDDGKIVNYKRLTLEDFDNKFYSLALYGFHDKLVSNTKLLRRGDIVAIACTAMDEGKYPRYSIALMTLDAANKVKYRAASTNANATIAKDEPLNF